jgi:formylglycine-generating enzyme required for sulfatase activity
MDEVRIFISYAREDETRVKQLYQWLADAGFQPWLDREHIIPGMRWEPVIKKALKQSDFVLVCLSATSINKRGFLQREIKQALEQSEEKLEHDVYLIPARLDDCKVPDALSELQWVDLFEDDGWQWLLKAIEYGLKQRGKTMPTPVSSAAQIEHAASSSLPSDSATEKTSADSHPVVMLPSSTPNSNSDEPVIFTDFGSVNPGLVIDIWRVISDPTIENSSSAITHEPFTDDLNGVPLEMIFVPGGSFKMGSPEGTGDDEEKPQHDVTVPGFYIGKYPITQEQWKAVMGKNPSHFKGDPALPVECISWNDAKKYCEKLARMTGQVYRLPSEAEWEYACRAGTTGDHAGEPNAIAWYWDNSDNKTHPVGQKSPNAFGLFDMHGNVMECCEDVWHDSYKDAPTDGSAWLSGGDSIHRVVRGGSWGGTKWDCCSAARCYKKPDYPDIDLGVRVVVSAKTLTP